MTQFVQLYPDREARRRWLKERMISHLRANYGKDMDTAEAYECWQALSRTVMEILAPRWEQSRKRYQNQKQAHYFSAEFLIGRSLANNLINLGIYEDAEAVCRELGFALADIEAEEIDPGLGNGGLGRLAACFLDSAATLNYPVSGYGLLYRYGLFRQEIKDGFQQEVPDAWMEQPYPFSCRRQELACEVKYQDLTVKAIPYDLPITGYATDNINVLRLWKPEPVEDFDYNLFNSQRFDDAVIERNRVQDINRVLYPNDSSYEGKILRVRQQYFFVSASLQMILKEFAQDHPIQEFPHYHVFQLNDTHPVLAIPELMRLLTQEYGQSWDAAWAICRESFAYTNHTTLAEALEKWEVGIFRYLFPDILHIILRLDEQFRREAGEQGLVAEEIEALAPVHQDQVHMAALACYAAFQINGVAAVHSQILKDDTLHGYYRLWPKRFTNKTNGVTPRRWLRGCNRGLSNLLTELVGSDQWISQLDLLTHLQSYQDDPAVLEQVQRIKQENKQQLAHFLHREYGLTVDPESLFDVQVKRLHEYKRQLLNLFEILDRYRRLKAGAPISSTPVTYFFAAKAAPGYYRAKAIIKLIHEVARQINQDPAAQELMRVYFLENYRVTLGEQMFPATDLSEQISTSGKEASGTGNMKFMMNGALTLGTYDGANIEILEAVGAENIFMFGPRPQDFPATFAFYDPHWQYEHIPGLKEVVNCLIDQRFDDGNTGMFQDLYAGLLQGDQGAKSDPYYVLGDFDEYRTRRREAHDAYQEKTAWAKRCWLNIVQSGRFSSDRAIQEYARDIWRIEPSRI